MKFTNLYKSLMRRPKISTMRIKFYHFNSYISTRNVTYYLIEKLIVNSDIPPFR